ncbi:MAG: MarR family transcriptional regulator [Eubacterium sp.]
MIHEKHIGFEVKSLSNLIKRRIDTIEGNDGITGMQGYIIGYIYDHPDREIFQRDVEKECSIRRSTATGILKLMEKNGFITREAVGYDARLKKLVLTDKALAHQQNFMAEIEQIERSLQAHLTAKEVTDFRRILKQMKKNMA